MTTRSLLSILGRRWYVLLLGVLASFGAFVAMEHAGGAYTAQTRVSFVAPGIPDVGQTDDGQLDTLVSFAAAIERDYHGGPADRLSANVTLYGAGVTEGEQVLLPNSGGQWQMSFGTPALDISVVGPSPEWVRAELDRTVARVKELTERQQAGVTPADRITTLVTPAEAPIGYAGSTKGMQARAAVVLLALGVGLSAGAAALLDGLVSRRRARRTAIALPPVRAARPLGGTS